MPTVYSWSDAILMSLARVLSDVAGFLPKLAGAAGIVVIGWITSGVVETLVSRGLRMVGFNRAAHRAGIDRFLASAGLPAAPAAIAGRLVYWTLMLTFVTAAASVLGLSQFSVVLSALIAYIPKVFVALTVLVVGAVSAQIVGNLVRGSTATANVRDGELLSLGARAAILGFAALMALDQLQIAPTIVSGLWTALVQMLALAIGLAFGLGGRHVAGRLAEGWYTRLVGPDVPEGTAAPSDVSVNRGHARLHRIASRRARPLKRPSAPPPGRAGGAAPDPPASPAG
jgi:hypothetical protein